MPQEPVEATPPPTPGQEQLLFQETDSLVHATDLPTVLPTRPEGFLQHELRYRYRQVRRWVSNPSVKVFIALVIVATISFFPALLANVDNQDQPPTALPLSGPGLNASSVGSSGATGCDGLSDRLPRWNYTATFSSLIGQARKSYPCCGSPRDRRR